MYILTLDVNLRRCRIKVLELYLSQHSAIDSIRIIGSKVPNIKSVRTSSNLLIRCESNTYLSMSAAAARLVRCDNLSRRCHNLSNSCLIISP